MTQRVRAFFGLRFRAARKIRQVLDELDSMDRPVKPVDPSGLHVTLKFLGEIPLTDLPELQRAFHAAVQGLASFDVELCGIGAFPKLERPAVVWMGLREPGTASAPSVKHLANRLEQQLNPLGFPSEKRAFQPHLTLARIRGRAPQRLMQLMDDLQTTRFGCQTVTEVHLMAAHSTGRRNAYLNLDSISLQGECSS